MYDKHLKIFVTSWANAWNHDRIEGDMVQEAGILHDICVLDSQEEIKAVSLVK
jgi:HD superfamily phosphohydrolase YqeK